MNKTIWLVRHGQSAANAGLASPSPATIPLTEKGIEQAELFANYFSETPSLIVVSPYLRTQETARPFINRFNLVQVENWDVHEFTYLSLSRFGLSTMGERLPFVQEFWKRCEADYCDGEGAESFADFIARTQKAIEELKNSKHERIVVFSHGQFIRTLMWLILTGRKVNGNDEMKMIYEYFCAVPYPNTAFVKLNFIGDEIYISSISTEHLPLEKISY